MKPEIWRSQPSKGFCYNSKRQGVRSNENIHRFGIVIKLAMFYIPLLSWRLTSPYSTHFNSVSTKTSQDVSFMTMKVVWTSRSCGRRFASWHPGTQICKHDTLWTTGIISRCRGENAIFETTARRKPLQHFPTGLVSCPKPLAITPLQVNVVALVAVLSRPYRIQTPHRGHPPVCWVPGMESWRRSDEIFQSLPLLAKGWDLCRGSWDFGAHKNWETSEVLQSIAKAQHKSSCLFSSLFQKVVCWKFQLSFLILFHSNLNMIHPAIFNERNGPTLGLSMSPPNGWHPLRAGPKLQPTKLLRGSCQRERHWCPKLMKHCFLAGRWNSKIII